MMFHQFGLDTMVPPKARYAIMIGLTCLPVLLLCVFFWFFPDDPEPFAEEVTSNAKVEAVPAANKKKAEKIDWILLRYK
jgi:hypothetical protein